jgi:hypothetical protein
MQTARRNARGYVIGEAHHRARLSDAVVHELRDLREHQRLRYAQIIALFAERVPPVPLTYAVVRDICLYRRRTNL